MSEIKKSAQSLTILDWNKVIITMFTEAFNKEARGAAAVANSQQFTTAQMNSALKSLMRGAEDDTIVKLNV